MACAQFEQKRNLQEEPEEAQGINQSDGTGAGIALTWVARPEWAVWPGHRDWDESTSLLVLLPT